MKHVIPAMKIFRSLIVVIVICISCSDIKTTEDYLEEVLKNLNKIESASYFSEKEGWNPGDTAATYLVQHYVEAYNNPQDTTIGASWVDLNQNDKMHLEFAYDGKMRTLIHDDIKGMVIDSFTFRKLPFRPVNPPFYCNTKNIIQYALETNDSIVLERQTEKDFVYIKLTIFEDRQVEFFGKAHYIPESPYSTGDPTSRYELWIDQSTSLPYKYRREMSHNISVESVSNTTFNKLMIEDFSASEYFPKNNEVRQYGESKKESNPDMLLGKKAPDWQLTNPDGGMISLSDLESKVILLQFTSVSCGPCKASIPFLRQLTTELNKEDFDLIAIESTSTNSNVLRSYRNRNDFDYKYLMSTKQVLKDYSVKSFPVFFVLDRDRIIKEVINGYSAESTDIMIRELIDQLLQINISGNNPVCSMNADRIELL